MARQERNSVDYFPHTVTHGRKMFYLRSKYKNDGYAVWFMLIEQLGRTEYHYLDLSDDIQLMYLSSEFMVGEEVLKDIINILVKFGDFDTDLWENHRILFNEKFVQSITDAYKKRNNECISKSNLYKRLGIPNEGKSTPNQPISILKVSGSTQSKVKEIKEEKSKGNKTIENKSLKQFQEIARTSFENVNCLFGTEFKKVWFDLIQTPNWRKKTQKIYDYNLKRLTKFDEDFAMALVESSIAGGYKGVVFQNTAVDYQKYLKSKNGTNSNTSAASKDESRSNMVKLARSILSTNTSDMSA